MRNDWIAERIAEIRAWGRKKTKSGLAKALGLSPSRVSEIIAGTRGVSATEAVAIARYLEMPEIHVLDRLSGGRLNEAGLGQIFVVGFVEAGVWQPALEREPEDWKPSPVSPDRRYAQGRQFGLEVRGPSMNEVYPEGSVVVCVPSAELGRAPRPGERVVVERRRKGAAGIEATLKELRRDESGADWLWPRSSNPNFQQPWPLRPEPAGAEDEGVIRLVALVIGSYRPEG